MLYWRLMKPAVFLAAAFFLAVPLTSRVPGDDAVTAWIQESAVPLNTVEAGHGFKDLNPLKKILRDVRVVGLGEATHGTREFFQLKHRLLEFLVREMDYRIFAIEASAEGCRAINDYVLRGEGDPAAALAGQKFWTWDTHEVRDMIAWMREYNRKSPDSRKVSFLGYDLQHLDQGMLRLEKYFDLYLPSGSEAVREALGPIRIDPFDIAKLPGAPDADKTRILARLYAVLGRLVFNETPLIREGGEEEYRDALNTARILTQFYYAYSKPMMSAKSEETGAALRDLFMAHNIEYILRTGGADTRIVVWAHNGHISTASWGPGYRAMGSHLRDILGDAYYSLGFAFNRGGFQSRLMDPESERNGALIEHRVDDAPEGSIGWFLARPGLDKYLLDFRSAPDIPEVLDWLKSAHPMRFIGAAYGPKHAVSSLASTVPLEHFDGIAFIDDTTRAVPNPSGKRGPYAPVKKDKDPKSGRRPASALLN